MLDFSHKTVVIAGGENGIGRAAAIRFGEAGARVVIAGIADKAGEECAALIGDSGRYVHVDITNEEEVVSFANAMESEEDGVDVIVNSAGVLGAGDVVATSEGLWRKIFDVNVVGMFLLTKALVGGMIRRKTGVIVNLGSEAGLVAIPGQIAYNASKAAVISMTKSLSVDLAKYGIRANVVCPGTTLTPMVENALAQSENPEKLRRWLESCRPLNRLGKADEIAMAIVAMASDELGYATGSVLQIDGGYTAQ